VGSRGVWRDIYWIPEFNTEYQPYLIMLLSLALWIQATGFFTYLRGSGYVYPEILSLQMVAIAFFGGMILMTDIRLLGWAKLALLLLVLVHALVFRKSVYNKVAEYDRDGRIPGLAKLAAGLSLLLWMSIACMGRGIGYVEPPPDIHAQLFNLLHL
jgi:hypothetical protein